MSPNITKPKFSTATNNNTNTIDNNYSCSKKDRNIKNFKTIQKRVIVTEHPCNPCPQLFSDIFNSILIECIDPSHENNENNEE